MCVTGLLAIELDTLTKRVNHVRASESNYAQHLNSSSTDSSLLPSTVPSAGWRQYTLSKENTSSVQVFAIIKRPVSLTTCPTSACLSLRV